MQDMQQATQQNLKRRNTSDDNLSRRTGLVLEGGGMRGIYTAGVLDVFMEHGVTFDGVIGVSAGAVHGSSYVSGQAGRNIRYYKKYCRDKRFMSMRNWLFSGNVVGEKFCYHDLSEILEPYDYEAFDASGTAFYVVCSNVETGKPEYLRVTDMKGQIDLLRASASLPLVSRIVNFDGKKLMDGAYTDSIPVAAFHNQMGYKKIVVVQTRQRGYVKKQKFNPVVRLWYHRYPRFVRALERRSVTYNRSVEQIERLEAKGKIFVIRPDADLNLGRMEPDPEKLQQVYEIGRGDAKARLEEMLAWRDGGRL